MTTLSEEKRENIIYEVVSAALSSLDSAFPHTRHKQCEDAKSEFAYELHKLIEETFERNGI